MTNWDLSFDYAATFILIMLFVWYYNEKRIPLRSHAAFLLLITAAFVSDAFEILATHMARAPEIFNNDIFYSTLTIQTLAINLVPVAFANYILQLANIDIKKVKPLHFLFMGSVIFNVAAAIFNPLIKWSFTFENEHFYPSYTCYISYVIDAVMLIISIYILITQRRKFRFLKAIPVFFVLFSAILACVGQLVLYVATLNFMIAAICITLYHYQQNPESATDAITRLFNRRFLGEYLQTKFMEHKEFGAIMIAMDDFKFINKTYGVDCGDSLLRQVGGYLEEIEKSAQVFRFGSDEFCVILNKNVSDMKKTAEEIQARFHHPWYTDSQAAIMMSASICCIRCPQEADSYNMLVDVADYTMGIAKKTKKGKITMAADVELTKVYNDKAIERAVKLALAKDELMVHYQPIYSVEKKKYCSAEALVRLYNKKLGWISPEDFIPIAEKNGMIIEMGEVILKKVCQFIKNYNLADTSIEYIEVNISPAQLVQMDFADRAIAIMKEYGVKANQMNFEITETSMISSLATVKDNINKLINYGITFALDDYGSGYANIDYINHMPFTLIKLDKYIIWDSFKNPKAGVTLEYTIGMMNALNLYIVAEGVETEEMYQTLADFGCHYMQGWYYSKAVCEEDFMELIGERVS